MGQWNDEGGMAAARGAPPAIGPSKKPKQKWTEQQEEQLVAAVTTQLLQGTTSIDWTYVAKQLHQAERTGRPCRH